MSTITLLTIIAFCLSAICVLVLFLLFTRKNQSAGGSIIFIGILAALFLAFGFFLLNYVPSSKYEAKNKENYMKLSEDPQYKGYTIYFDGKMVNEFPEYNDNGKFSYTINEKNGTITITTKMMTEEMEQTSDTKYFDIQLPVDDPELTGAAATISPISVLITYLEPAPAETERNYFEFAQIQMMDGSTEELKPFESIQYFDETQNMIVHKQEAVLDQSMMDLDLVHALVLHVWNPELQKINESKDIIIELQ